MVVPKNNLAAALINVKDTHRNTHIKAAISSSIFVLQKLLPMPFPCESGYPLHVGVTWGEAASPWPHETLASGRFVKLLPLQSLLASTREATGALASILDHKVEERARRRETKILTKNHQEPSMLSSPIKRVGSNIHWVKKTGLGQAELFKVILLNTTFL